MLMIQKEDVWIFVQEIPTTRTVLINAFHSATQDMQIQRPSIALQFAQV